ncbi:hypothetical protein [Streptomyces sp. BK340]|uniref:hypothetical protein n=1 Tax=Streptomyces sp. BK340 TaxID=2572903 RepID=UPI001645590B|nr:hypothetical protein [Streptomyces sp. BK340]
MAEVLRRGGVAAELGGTVVGDQPHPAVGGVQAGHGHDGLPGPGVRGRQVRHLHRPVSRHAVPAVQGPRAAVVVGRPGPGQDQEPALGASAQVTEGQPAEVQLDGGAERGLRAVPTLSMSVTGTISAVPPVYGGTTGARKPT